MPSVTAVTAVRPRGNFPRKRSPAPLAAVCALAAGLVALWMLGAASFAQAAPPAGCSQLNNTVTCSFTSTGSEQQLTIPAGVTNVHVAAVGGPGGSGDAGGTFPIAPGGAGGAASGDLPVSSGETLYVEVGATGATGTAGAGGAGAFDGGGAGGSYQGGGGGGGATDARTVSCGSSCPGDSTSLGSRLLVAAGGGGGGGSGVGSGAGGGPGSAGGNGTATSDPKVGGHGGGGGSTSAGAGGQASDNPGCSALLWPRLLGRGLARVAARDGDGFEVRAVNGLHRAQDVDGVNRGGAAFDGDPARLLGDGGDQVTVRFGAGTWRCL